MLAQEEHTNKFLLSMSVYLHHIRMFSGWCFIVHQVHLQQSITVSGILSSVPVIVCHNLDHFHLTPHSSHWAQPVPNLLLPVAAGQCTTVQAGPGSRPAPVQCWHGALSRTVQRRPWFIKIRYNKGVFLGLQKFNGVWWRHGHEYRVTNILQYTGTCDCRDSPGWQNTSHNCHS